MTSEIDQGMLAKGLVARLDAQTDADKAEALKQQVALGQQQLSSMAEGDIAQLASDQAKVDQMGKSVRLAQTQVDSLTIRAGIDGLLEG
ncbi:MAG: hypothetical protein ACRD2D_00585, partial [Terriglobales bacterium]